uniref:Uncharacterized protein n=1 Tax=Vespula pensylvanica TaxID=30213 RepID=A0A834KEV3_VESPE|nr:hypothetical protein H0235_014315 [Vespula pensylvanica]
MINQKSKEKGEERNVVARRVSITICRGFCLAKPAQQARQLWLSLIGVDVSGWGLSAINTEEKQRSIVGMSISRMPLPTSIQCSLERNSTELVG